MELWGRKELANQQPDLPSQRTRRDGLVISSRKSKCANTWKSIYRLLYPQKEWPRKGTGYLPVATFAQFNVSPPPTLPLIDPGLKDMTRGRVEGEEMRRTNQEPLPTSLVCAERGGEFWMREKTFKTPKWLKYYEIILIL